MFLYLVWFGALVNEKGLGFDVFKMFTIAIRHTEVSIAHLVTPSEYLHEVVRDSTLPKQSQVKFLETKKYDLLQQESRKDAACAIWALLAYLHSGSAMIGRLELAAREDIGSYYISYPGASILTTISDFGKDKSDASVDYKKAVDRMVPGIRGLVNVRNSCYINAVLQALVAATEFRPSHALRLKGTQCNPTEVLLQEFFTVKQALTLPYYKPVKPYGFIVSVLRSVDLRAISHAQYTDCVGAGSSGEQCRFHAAFTLPSDEAHNTVLCQPELLCAQIASIVQ